MKLGSLLEFLFDQNRFGRYQPRVATMETVIAKTGRDSDIRTLPENPEAQVAVLIGNDRDAHLLPQISPAGLGERKSVSLGDAAFQPAYESVALPARSEAGSSEEMDSLGENASGLHVVQSFRLDA